MTAMCDTYPLALTGLHVDYSLSFVDSTDTYSVYRDANGETVYLAHGTAQRLVDLSTMDLATEWDDYRHCTGDNSPDMFREWLRVRVIEPDDVDNVEFCADCETPCMEDMHSTSANELVCDVCIDTYWFCHGCEEYDAESTSTVYLDNGDQRELCDTCVRNYWQCYECGEWFETTQTTLSGEEVCESCLGELWSYCEECDGYRRDDDCSHDHDADCCESPAQLFTMRNDGDVPLANDTRVTVPLPSGVISEVGLAEIASHLRSCAWEITEDTLDGADSNLGAADKLRAMSWRIEELGDKWQTRDGNYTKRLSRFAYKEFGYKLSPEIVSRIGCIARNHSTGVDFAIEVTRDLNMSASDFYHGGSCWWQSYSESRCALKTNGGIGLRTFDSSGEVSGRAWIMPMRLTEDGCLTPTFDTVYPDAFVIFNGYGDLEGYAPARIVSHMVGMTYRKITFTCSPMYVNNDAGYLIASEEIASQYTDGSLRLSVSQHSSLFTREGNES